MLIALIRAHCDVWNHIRNFTFVMYVGNSGKKCVKKYDNCGSDCMYMKYVGLISLKAIETSPFFLSGTTES